MSSKLLWKSKMGWFFSNKYNWIKICKELRQACESGLAQPSPWCFILSTSQNF